MTGLKNAYNQLFSFRLTTLKVYRLKNHAADIRRSKRLCRFPVDLGVCDQTKSILKERRPGHNARAADELYTGNV